MKHLFILLTITLIGCGQKNEKSEADKDREDQIAKSKPQTFGDTLKITYEFHGDTIIQHRIDLKGTKDDRWDNTFTVKSIWSTRIPTVLNCRDTLIIKVDTTSFAFCFDAAIQKISLDITNDILDSLYLTPIRKELMQLRKGEIYKVSHFTYHLPFNLMRSIDFSILDMKTKKKAKKIRIEQYNTGFSEGRNYFFIGDKGDTLARFYVNEWMR